MLLFPVKAHPSLSGLIGALQGKRASLATALLKWNVRLIKKSQSLQKIPSGSGVSSPSSGPMLTFASLPGVALLRMLASKDH
jgi:hypothetical protein